MNNQNGFIGIVVLIIVALIVGGGGGYYAYRQQQQKRAQPVSQISADQETSLNTGGTITTTKTEEVYQEEDEGIIKTNIKIKADIAQTVDCGSENCFQQKFTTCEPATLKSDAGFASVDYKIIGPAAGGCAMTFMYTKNPNPAWMNKEMTCTFDNTIDFQKSVANVFSGVIEGKVVCTGPLYTTLRSM